MGAFGGSALRLLATFFYALEFCCAGIILGIYSYFLAVNSDRNRVITRDQKAIEGLSGVAVIYTIFAVLLTCFLGGVRFFAFLGVVLDFCFIGAFIALAVLLRGGDSSCTGYVTTPFGYGPVDPNVSGPGYQSSTGRQVTYEASQGLACRLNKACFAVAIIGAFLFLISMFLQIWVARHHQKEKKYGPSPANNYTSGSGRGRFWKRKSKRDALPTKDAELGAVNGTGAYVSGANDYRTSHETGYTGTTVNGAGGMPTNKYETGGYHTGPTGTAVDQHNGYNVAPTGTAANPYGYANTH